MYTKNAEACGWELVGIIKAACGFGDA